MARCRRRVGGGSGSIRGGLATPLAPPEANPPPSRRPPCRLPPQLTRPGRRCCRGPVCTGALAPPAAPHLSVLGPPVPAASGEQRAVGATYWQGSARLPSDVVRCGRCGLRTALLRGFPSGITLRAARLRPAMVRDPVRRERGSHSGGGAASSGHPYFVRCTVRGRAAGRSWRMPSNVAHKNSPTHLWRAALRGTRARWG